MLLNPTGEKIIESDLKNGNLIPFLLGAPGIGKSSIVRSICEKNGWGFHELLCNQIAMQADLTGCRTVTWTDNDGNTQAKQVFFPHAVVKEAIDDACANPGRIVVLFLDEVNRTTASVTSALLTFITARKIGTENLPENIRLIAAGNDDGNVISLDMASTTRFILRRCQPDADVFLKLGKIHPVIEDLLKSNPSLIYQDKNVSADEEEEQIYSEDDMEFQQIATPRTIMGLNRALLDNQNLILGMGEEELREYVEGFTGHTLFTEAAVTAIMASRFTMAAPRAVEAPARPPVMDSFRSVARITDIQKIVRGMTDEEKSDAILYMLYDKSEDYGPVIQELLRNYSRSMLMNGGQYKLTAIINSGSYNRDSYRTIIDAPAGTPLADSFRTIYMGQ